MTPKYTIKKTRESGQWIICDRKGGVVAYYPDKRDAELHAQRLVEDDAWHSSNRD